MKEELTQLMPQHADIEDLTYEISNIIKIDKFITKNIHENTLDITKNQQFAHFYQEITQLLILFSNNTIDVNEFWIFAWN